MLCLCDHQNARGSPFSFSLVTAMACVPATTSYPEHWFRVAYLRMNATLSKDLLACICFLSNSQPLPTEIHNWECVAAAPMWPGGQTYLSAGESCWSRRMGCAQVDCSKQHKLFPESSQIHYHPQLLFYNWSLVPDFGKIHAFTSSFPTLLIPASC